MASALGPGAPTGDQRTLAFPPHGIPAQLEYEEAQKEGVNLAVVKTRRAAAGQEWGQGVREGLLWGDVVPGLKSALLGGGGRRLRTSEIGAWEGLNKPPRTRQGLARREEGFREEYRQPQHVSCLPLSRLRTASGQCFQTHFIWGNLKSTPQWTEQYYEH